MAKKPKYKLRPGPRRMTRAMRRRIAATKQRLLDEMLHNWAKKYRPELVDEPLYVIAQAKERWDNPLPNYHLVLRAIKGVLHGETA